MDFCWHRIMSLLFNMLFRLVIDFLPRSKHLLISWLQSPSAVILEPQKIRSATVSPSISHEVMGLDAMILFFWMLSFKPTLSLSSFTFIKIELWLIYILSTMLSTFSSHEHGTKVLFNSFSSGEILQSKSFNFGENQLSIIPLMIMIFVSNLETLWPWIPKISLMFFLKVL